MPFSSEIRCLFILPLFLLPFRFDRSHRSLFLSPSSTLLLTTTPHNIPSLEHSFHHPPPLQPHITTAQHSLPHVTENNAPHHHHSHHPLSPLGNSKHHHPSHHPLPLPLFTTPHQHSQHLIIIITALKSASPLLTTPQSITIHSTAHQQTTLVIITTSSLTSPHHHRPYFFSIRAHPPPGSVHQNKSKINSALNGTA